MVVEVSLVWCVHSGHLAVWTVVGHWGLDHKPVAGLPIVTWLVRTVRVLLEHPRHWADTVQ